MYTTALTLLGLAAAATSAPTASTSSYAWTVTNWSAGCARSGCFYGPPSPLLHLLTPFLLTSSRLQHHRPRVSQ